MEGIVFDIQRFSVHDGPGIRTTVFLKGCNIRCLWCHNPESFTVPPQLSYDAAACTLCGACEEVCPNGVHLLTIEKGHTLARERCTGCGSCVAVCPNSCLKVFGKPMTVDEVFAEVEKDKKYYGPSGGGVTISGGEPTVQFDFLLAFAKRCKAGGLHVAMESNGIVQPENLAALAPYLDLVLLDYKATGEEKHKELTGRGNSEVLVTLGLLEEKGIPVILRCPIIQGLNDGEEHFAAIRWMEQRHKNIQKTEVMAYHSLGKQKWASLGMEYTLQDLPDAGDENKEMWQQKITNR